MRVFGQAELPKMRKNEIKVALLSLASGSTKVTYERLVPENLRLPQADYDAAKERLSSRIESMIALLHEDEKNRIETMLAYFGEEKVV